MVSMLLPFGRVMVLFPCRIVKQASLLPVSSSDSLSGFTRINILLWIVTGRFACRLASATTLFSQQ